jgi:hypothetical protein
MSNQIVVQIDQKNRDPYGPQLAIFMSDIKLDIIYNIDSSPSRLVYLKTLTIPWLALLPLRALDPNNPGAEGAVSGSLSTLRFPSFAPQQEGLPGVTESDKWQSS